MIKRFILVVANVIASLVVYATGTVSIDGVRFIEIKPESSTGLNAIYVVENTAGATINYRTSSDDIQWQKYSNLGGGYAEDINNVQHNGSLFTINAEQSDMGYIITDGNAQICFWIVNYANYTNEIATSLEIESSDCDRVILRPDKGAGYIDYFTITGRREVLDREIRLIYNTLEYSEADERYNEVRKTEIIDGFATTISLPVPLCDTEFYMMPDKFALEWGIGREIVSQSFHTSAVQVNTSAIQSDRSSDNEQKIESELGGSAPCEVAFRASITDAAIYHRWEISTYPEFDDIQLQYNDLEFTYTFTDAGMTYVRFVANNAEGSCEYVGDIYTISIGDSRLDCPNAFSPGTSEGINDEWKVSYRSIISFNCQIFNRWGQSIIELTDPSQGWDGRYNGKLVGSGVYFYVIKARGADGKEYNLSGDINIIGSRSNPIGNGSSESNNVTSAE